MRKPATTKDKEFIYLQEDGKIITFNPKTKALKEYNIDLKIKGSEMHFSNEKLYIIGGFQVKDYRKAPSSGFYKIKVSEFFKTKPINNITFQRYYLLQALNPLQHEINIFAIVYDF